MDVFLFRLMNDIAGQHALVDHVFIFTAHWLPYALGLMVVTAIVWPKMLGLDSHVPPAVAFMAAVLASAVKNMVVFFYYLPRPFDVFEVTQLIEQVGHGAFPSGHALFFSALAMVLFLYNRTVGIIFGVCAVLIGLARIASGIHWPSDVLAGLSLGVVVGTGMFLAAQRYIGTVRAS